jgi:Pyridoxamine 5'-phosphate oxidase
MLLITEQLTLPSSYGSPNRLLDWASVEQRLVDSLHYWLATVRCDGSPHVVPVDGMWLDGGCYFGGDSATVHIRNLRRDGRATLHLEEGEIGDDRRRRRQVEDAVSDHCTAAHRRGPQEIRLPPVGGFVSIRRLAARARQGVGVDSVVRGCDAFPFRSWRLNGRNLGSFRRERFPRERLDRSASGSSAGWLGQPHLLTTAV